MYDAGGLPPVDAWHVDMNFARPLWRMDTIEDWIRERWQKEPPPPASAGPIAGLRLAGSWPRRLSAGNLPS
jgi:hypothetical protein